MVQTVLLAMLMVIGQVLPSHCRECGGCLMAPVGETQLSVVVPVADAALGCAHACCRADEAAQAPAPATDSEKAPCGRSNCDGGCKCPGACCATGQLVAVARVMSFDLGLAAEAEPMAIPELRVSAREAQLSLLRPPRA